MNTDSGELAEIQSLNAAYLRLIQRMLREGDPDERSQLGMSSEVAAVLVQMTETQIVRLSSTNLLLCRFRFEDKVLLSALADKGIMEKYRDVMHAENEAAR